MWKTARYTNIRENSNSGGGAAGPHAGRKRAMKFVLNSGGEQFRRVHLISRAQGRRGGKFDPQCVWRALIRVTFFQSCNPLQKWQSPYITLSAGKETKRRRQTLSLSIFSAPSSARSWIFLLSESRRRAVCCEPAAWLRREREERGREISKETWDAKRAPGRKRKWTRFRWVFFRRDGYKTQHLVCVFAAQLIRGGLFFWNAELLLFFTRN